MIARSQSRVGGVSSILNNRYSDFLKLSKPIDLLFSATILKALM